MLLENVLDDIGFYGDEPTDDGSAGGDVSAAGDSSMEDGEGREPVCMETNHEEVRMNAADMKDDGPPLCFTIATIFEEPEYLSMMSEPICMYRCSWEEDCNYYMEFDDEDFKDFEYEVCAGQDVKLDEGCFDMGFCDDTNDARDWPYFLWPYDAEDEEAVEWMAEDGMWYWIPTVYTQPAGCLLEYEIMSAKNIVWEWDEWCMDEDMEESCQSIQFWPALLDEGARGELYLKIRVMVSGTNTKKDFYQFFQWDWEYFNEMANWEGGEGDEFECPPDAAGCNDWMDEYYYWADDYYMDDDCYDNCDGDRNCEAECDMEMSDSDMDDDTCYDDCMNDGGETLQCDEACGMDDSDMYDSDMEDDCYDDCDGDFDCEDACDMEMSDSDMEDDCYDDCDGDFDCEDACDMEMSDSDMEDDTCYDDCMNDGGETLECD